MLKPTTHAEELKQQQRLEKIDLSSPKQLLLGFVFGVVFGFLLQKGGVAKFHVLEGQLLLTDFTVVKVMLSAVVVGMVGIHLMARWGFVKMHIKPTQYLANTTGGLIFGAGFALSAYCPGTGAAALGQGNYDAFLMIVGMLAGSYLHAECSGWIKRRVKPLGDVGEKTLHDWLPGGQLAVAIGAAAMLVVVLVLLEMAT